MQGKKITIPRLSEIAKYNGSEDKINIAWDKILELERLTANPGFQIGSRADRYLGYYIWYLTNKNILARIHDNPNTYVILKKVMTKPNPREFLNPSHFGISYGFYRKEDAQAYAKSTYPRTYENLIIEKYEEIFQEDREE
mgnify:CR=1 FL=1